MTTLQDIIDAVRLLADMRTSQYVSDSDITIMINGSYRELDDILIAKNQDYRLVIQGFTPGTSVNVISNNTMIALPADFDELRGVDYYWTNAQQPWVTLQSFSMPERNRFNFPLMQTMAGLPLLRYMLQDGYVAIAPLEKCAGTYRLLYTPELPILVNTTDTIPYYFDNRSWSDYVVFDCCIKIMNMQQEDPSAYMAQKAAIKTRIESLAGKRDSGAPQRGRNTRGGNAYGQFGFPFGTYGRY